MDIKITEENRQKKFDAYIIQMQYSYDTRIYIYIICTCCGLQTPYNFNIRPHIDIISLYHYR